MISVSSSNIRAIGYDPDNLILQIKFHDGSVYQYRNVPSFIFDSFLRAGSKGQYANAHIYKNYPSRKIS